MIFDMTRRTGGGSGKEWARPSDWPDIDALAAQIVGNQDCLYLTYDLRKTPGYGWIGLYGKTADSSAWTVERGHVSNGAFVADETIAVNSNAYLRRALADAEGEVQLWRVSSTGHFTKIGFATNTAASSNNFQNAMQPCVQRAGKLPWCETWFGAVGTSATQICGGTVWLERDALIPGKLAVVTTLQNCWLGCFNLQSLDLSGWDTSAWGITTLQACWQNCYKLKSIDLSSWDTSGWEVASLYTCWSGCSSLESLDLSGWDTSGWAVGDTRNIFASCYSLTTLKTPANLGITSAANTTGVPNLANLQEFSGYEIEISHTYNVATKLTAESLVNILNRLRTVSSATTITLGNPNKLKLTADQIAIATGKGWTVA